MDALDGQARGDADLGIHDAAGGYGSEGLPRHIHPGERFAAFTAGGGRNR